jgi:hypothetical protein
MNFADDIAELDGRILAWSQAHPAWMSLSWPWNTPVCYEQKLFRVHKIGEPISAAGAAESDLTGAGLSDVLAAMLACCVAGECGTDHSTDSLVPAQILNREPHGSRRAPAA